MAIIDAQTDKEVETANGRFFIAPDNRPSGLIVALAANLTGIAETSHNAKERLQAMTPEDHKEYQDALSRMRTAAHRDEAEVIVGRMQTTLEEAYRYSDATSAVRAAGEELAVHVQRAMDQGVGIINGHFYWSAADRTGRSRLCGTDESGERFIVFGMLAIPDKEIGQEAQLEDYVTLIQDVEAAMIPPEQGL